MNKKYKVEAKGSLWEVTLEHGEYSDWDIEHYIFSGNTEDEVWEFVKIWAKEGGIEDSYRYGLVYGENKYQFRDFPIGHYSSEMNWETDYGDSYEVRITRANVIYVNP